MKTTYIETFVDNKKILGSDLTSICKNIDTQRKLKNAINKHLRKLKALENIHECIKGNFEIRYYSVYN